MNKTAVLVNAWAVFEEQHPEAELEDFCRHYLTRQREKAKTEGEFLGGVMPPQADQMLVKVMDRIMRLYMVYAVPALEGTGAKRFEEFHFLNAIAHLQTPRKTDVISHTINELSSGLLMIDRLVTMGYITEHENPDDGRSKLLKLTDTGEQILLKCYERLNELNRVFFRDMTEDDMQLCVQLLRNIEVKFSGSWQQQRLLPFADIYKSATGEEIQSPTSPDEAAAGKRSSRKQTPPK